MKITIINRGNGAEQLFTIIPCVQTTVPDQALFDAVAERVGLAADLLKQDFQADQGQNLILFQNNQRILLVGLGSAPSFEEMIRTFRLIAFKRRKNFPIRLQIDLSFIPEDTISISRLAEAAINGLKLGAHQLHHYKTSASDRHPVDQEAAELQFILPSFADHASVEQSVTRGLAIAETQRSIMDLVNAPSNKKNPQAIADWAAKSAQRYAYRCEVLDKSAIEQLGLHALLAVNQGSAHPPAFIITEYEGPGATQKIGLVGKGVTFDTGGLSIKPSTNMHHMKSDMGGAAAVLGTIEAAAKLQLPVHLIGIVPSTDNSVDALALKPSDVIDSYSGKTIEIIDTDAEGRLILADGLAYIVRQYAPDTLIDLATLTGSAIRTFGYHAACLFSNNDQLANDLYLASERSGELLWRLPLWKIYEEDLQSDVADLRNYSGRPTAGAIGAAKFLEAFIQEHPAWAHLDIAGVAFRNTEFSKQKSATAFGVRLLIEYIQLLQTN